MSEPFVPDEASLRGGLQRAELEGGRLSGERARIAALLVAAPRSKAWVAGLLASLVLGIAGFAGAIALETKREARRQRLEAAMEDGDIAAVEARTAECRRSELELMPALLQCEAAHPGLRTAPRVGLPCACQAGDPLCSCL